MNLSPTLNVSMCDMTSREREGIDQLNCPKGNETLLYVVQKSLSSVAVCLISRHLTRKHSYILQTWPCVSAVRQAQARRSATGH